MHITSFLIFHNKFKEPANSLNIQGFKSSPAPNKGGSCTNAAFCVSVSNAPAINRVIENSDNVRAIVRKVVRRLRKVTGHKNSGNSYLNSADINYNLIVESTKGVPAESSSC